MFRGEDPCGHDIADAAAAWAMAGTKINDPR